MTTNSYWLDMIKTYQDFLDGDVVKAKNIMEAEDLGQKYIMSGILGDKIRSGAITAPDRQTLHKLADAVDGYRIREFRSNPPNLINVIGYLNWVGPRRQIVELADETAMNIIDIQELDIIDYEVVLCQASSDQWFLDMNFQVSYKRHTVYEEVGDAVQILLDVFGINTADPDNVEVTIVREVDIVYGGIELLNEGGF